MWAFLGDGETDEPEALGALHVAADEGLDNLIFVVNCNLQRLDGPVRGNGKIIQELEAVFRGSGWNVIKVILGREWDPLLAADASGVLVERLNTIVDGWWQRYHVEGGGFMRQHFFGADPRLAKMVEHLSDTDIWNLKFGGHDYRKVYAAYRAATESNGRPTALLVKTVKGWALGKDFEGRYTTHQQKKLNAAQLRAFRDVLHLPIPDAALVEDPPYFHPGTDSPEVEYLLERRRALGGTLPLRKSQAAVPELPAADVWAEFHEGTPPKREVSTTMAFVQLLRKLLRTPGLGPRIVPIIPDEARTFGMESLFKELGIYASGGQLYEPVDHNMILRYQEARDGQILEEGITEAGALASFTAAGTAHATHGVAMVPFYIFYSMFGYQRVGDLVWAFGDARGRGFLLGATAGRTTLQGEGLQHDDGHSPVLFSVVPNVRIFDPAYAYELAVIVKDGLKAMVEDGRDVFYYITLYNENYEMPPMPPGAEEGIVRGIYRLRRAGGRARAPRTVVRQRRDRARGAARRRHPRRRLRRRRRRLERHELPAAARRRARRRTLEPPPPGGAGAYAVSDGAARRRPGTGDRRVGVHEAAPGLGRALPAAGVDPARHRRLRPLRHAGGAAPPLRGGRRAHRRGDGVGARPRRSDATRGSGRRDLGARPRSRPPRPGDALAGGPGRQTTVGAVAAAAGSSAAAIAAPISASFASRRSSAGSGVAAGIVSP